MKSYIPLFIFLHFCVIFGNEEMIVRNRYPSETMMIDQERLLHFLEQQRFDEQRNREDEELMCYCRIFCCCSFLLSSISLWAYNSIKTL